MRSRPLSVSVTGPIAGGSTPWNSGCPSGKPSRPPPGAGEANTGSFWRSASATALSQPPLASISGPATITGFSADSIRFARSLTAAGSAPALLTTERLIACPASPSSTSTVQSSIGIERKTGPFGGIEARWIPRASAATVSSARGVS